MSETPSQKNYAADLSRDELMSALFANLVLQQGNMAMMFLGKIPNPQSGKETVDLEAAQVFIDNLEMLELKTKGNLSKNEADVLKQSLMNARMTFVEVANKSPKAPAPDQPAEPSAASPKTAASDSTTPPPASGESVKTDASSEAEAHRKFVKKY